MGLLCLVFDCVLTDCVYCATPVELTGFAGCCESVQRCLQLDSTNEQIEAKSPPVATQSLGIGRGEHCRSTIQRTVRDFLRARAVNAYEFTEVYVCVCIYVRDSSRVQCACVIINSSLRHIRYLSAHLDTPDALARTARSMSPNEIEWLQSL